jgi:uncharacterized protein YecT (DUF1311 family)
MQSDSRLFRWCIFGFGASWACILPGLGAPASAQFMNAKDSPCSAVVTTVDLSACLAKARTRADNDLNRTYARISAALGREDRRRLVLAERSWLAFRDSMCAAERGLYGAGTAAGPAYLACVEGLTRRQAEALRSGFGWKAEK